LERIGLANCPPENKLSILLTSPSPARITNERQRRERFEQE
jgi:hypothetical protein